MGTTERDASVTVYMVGNAHIDPVWLWPVREGREEVLATYGTAISLIHDWSGYVFTSGGAITYEWVRQDDPQLFAAIQEAVRQGRWVLVNGWWLQPDCNIPSGESFARHALYGQRYLGEHFGRRARVGYNVDSFGHAATLPQLLKQAGLDYYVFFRPGPHEKALPQGPFWWEGPGGARVLACRPPLHYGTSGEADIVARIKEAAAQAPEGFPAVLCFYGVGNHGGGPTRRNVQEIVEMASQQGPARPVFASPEPFFERATAARSDWPVVRDELQHHSRGCYTALSRIKRENRQAETALGRAERMMTLASLFAPRDSSALSEAQPTATAQIREAWQGVLFCQFHDILAGTSIREAYEDVWRLYDHAREVTTEGLQRALEALGAQIDIPDRGAQPVLVWNTLPWERTEPVHLTIPMGGWRADFHGTRYPGTPTISDLQGGEIPCQVVDVELDNNTYMVHIEAVVTVPALGARLLYVQVPESEPPSAVSPVSTAGASISETLLDNGIVRLRFDERTGWIASIADARTESEFLAGPGNVALVIDDPSDTWSHDVESFRRLLGSFVGRTELLHGGPIRQTVRVRGAWCGSAVVQEISLVRGMPYIDVVMKVDWREQLKMLKLAFPLQLQGGTVTASAPYGWIVREPNGEEEPCQSWLDLTGVASGEMRGMVLINDSKYGYDALRNELRLSILRSPVYAFHKPRRMVPGVTYHYIDQGEQVVRYRLFPHHGGWQAVNPDRRSAELHEPLLAQLAKPQTGRRSEGSLLRVEPAHVILTTLKMAEEGDGLIARGYETIGEPADLVLVSDELGRAWRCRIAPHEIWTLELPLAGGEPTKLSLLEESAE